MIKKTYKYTLGNDKTIEKVVADENVNINHMILNNGECLPEHHSNSNVYMVVIRGAVTLGLDENPEETFAVGSIINIAYNTKMNVCNKGDETLEIFVIKAPAPHNYTA